MALTVLLVSLLLLLLIGVPVAFALGLAAMACLAVMDLPMIVAMQRMAASINMFALMAIPFFILAGDLMAQAGIARRLVAVATAALGPLRGGLGHVSIGSSVMFGAVSGSAVACVSGLGSTLIPMMQEQGYDDDFAVNVTSTSAVLGILIPPSHNMILYATAAGAGVSVADLFMAGVLPGLATAGLLMLAAHIIAVRRGYAAGAFPGVAALLRAGIAALPGLMTAVIIFVGVLAGVFTPTESAAIAVIYTLLVAVLVYRSLDWAGFAAALQSAARTTAMVMMIIATAGAFGWLLALNEAPSALAGLLAPLAAHPVLMILFINLILLLLGTFMDMAPLIIIATPIFLPLASAAGIDPVQFGIIMMLNLGIGLVTPPVGSVLFVGSAIGRITVERAIGGIWPFYLALLAALMVVSFVPSVSLWLPAVLK